MSGWHVNDRAMAENYGDDFPAINNLTIRGSLPNDQVPAPSKSSYQYYLISIFSEIKNSSRSTFKKSKTV